jgi:hypothetical protein
LNERVTVTTDTNLKMSTVVVDFLDRKRAKAKREEKIQNRERLRLAEEGRNILVYRGVPYVRRNAR